MGWSLTKEAKVKGAFVEHKRVDTPEDELSWIRNENGIPEKNISQVKVSDESKLVKASNF